MTTSNESREFIFAWLHVLDELTYYDLFDIPADATEDDVRNAFHRFCDTFHPDRHLSRAPDERAALLVVFKRGTEAYLALSDRGLRAQYDAQLMVETNQAPRRISHGARTTPAPGRDSSSPAFEEAARSPSSRPFARRAEELLAAGDLRQARLQLVMANHLDPDNQTLEAALKQIEARLAGPK
ncbi:MAG: DnaJ domain-containing protein [Polyangiaceae bacterium]|jgi:DnaJ-class molecular chaperone